MSGKTNEIDRACPEMTTAFRDLFVRRGESVTAFAKRTGFARDTVHRWIRGDRSPSIGHLAKLAEALGVEIPKLEAAVAKDREAREARKRAE